MTSPLSLQPLPTIERTAVPEWITICALEERIAAGDPFPIVEPERCTFVHRGPAIGVRLVHFGVGLPADLTYEQLDDTDWWVLALAVPAGTRLEYKLEIVDSFGTHLVDDALNPERAAHPFGVNSVCSAHGYTEPRWAQADPAGAGGRLVGFSVDSDAYDRRVDATVYLPAGFEGHGASRYPLLVVHDGSDYLLYAAAATVLDNLIADGSMPPTVVAFVPPGERLVEYADDPRHAALLTAELIPALEDELPLRAEPAGRFALGASFGAVASLAAAQRSPGFFGGLVLQSGSFAGAGSGCRPRPEALWRPVRRFVGDYLANPVPVAARVFVSCGAYESLICENRGLVPVLAGAGMQIRFVQQLDGHNWASWRDAFGLALPWVLGTTD